MAVAEKGNRTVISDFRYSILHCSMKSCAKELSERGCLNKLKQNWLNSAWNRRRKSTDEKTHNACAGLTGHLSLDVRYMIHEMNLWVVHLGSWPHNYKF
jgi:hypothetical protein